MPSSAAESVIASAAIPSSIHAFPPFFRRRIYADGLSSAVGCHDSKYCAHLSDEKTFAVFSSLVTVTYLISCLLPPQEEILALSINERRVLSSIFLS